MDLNQVVKNRLGSCNEMERTGSNRKGRLMFA